jgi:DNA-3-methyladenine glycosylase
VNFVCGQPDYGSAVLIRALAPESGLEVMRSRRGLDDPRKLCAGPGRLCQALGITRAHNGLPLDTAPFRLETTAEPRDIVVGPRIGISQAREQPWRFGAAGSPFLSKPFPAIGIGKRPTRRPS